MMGRNAAPTGNEQGKKGVGHFARLQDYDEQVDQSANLRIRLKACASSWLWKGAWVNVRTNFPKLCESRLCIALNDVHSSRHPMKYENAGTAL